MNKNEKRLMDLIYEYDCADFLKAFDGEKTVCITLSGREEVFVTSRQVDCVTDYLEVDPHSFVMIHLDKNSLYGSKLDWEYYHRTKKLIEVNCGTNLKFRCHNAFVIDWDDGEFRSEEDSKELESYLRDAGKEFDEMCFYPEFKKITPNSMQREALSNKQVLSVIEVMEILSKTDDMKTVMENAPEGMISKLSMKNKKVEVTFMEDPCQSHKVFKADRPGKDVMEKVKALPKKMVFSARLVVYEGLTESSEKCPVYYAVGKWNSSDLLISEPLVGPASEKRGILAAFLNLFCESGRLAKTVKVSDAYSYDILKPLLDSLSVELKLEDRLSALDKEVTAFLKDLVAKEEAELDDDWDDDDWDGDDWDGDDESDDNIDDIDLDFITELFGKAAKAMGFRMPEDDDNNHITPERKELSPGTTYNLSVNLRKGCYRHLSVPADASFDDLSEAILDAFDFFDRDHLYAFFMDNRKWSRYDQICSPLSGGGDFERKADMVTLADEGLKKDDKFIYLFDFGDEWTFNCKVLKVYESDATGISVIKSVGEAPEQYW